MSESARMVIVTSVLLLIFAVVCLAGGADGVAGVDVATVRATLTVVCVAHFLFCVYVWRDAILQFAVMRYAESQNMEKDVSRPHTAFAGGGIGTWIAFFLVVDYEKINFSHFGLIIMLMTHFVVLICGYYRYDTFSVVSNDKMRQIKEEIVEKLWPNNFGLPVFLLMFGVIVSIAILTVRFYGGEDVFVSVFKNNSLYSNGWYYFFAYAYFALVCRLFAPRFFAVWR